MINLATFQTTLTRHYGDLFATDAEYAMAKSRYTPDQLAVKMTQGLTTGDANKDGEGIKRTCKELGIPHTYKAIRAYLAGA